MIFSQLGEMSLHKFSEFLISRVKKFEWEWENAVAQGIPTSQRH